PMLAIEELHRITRAGGVVTVRVPYWNSQDWASDPTHRTRFNEYTFDFFDPSRRHGRIRPYYSKAKFAIRSEVFWMKPVWRYLPVTNIVGRRILSALARHIGGVIWVVEWELLALKSSPAFDNATRTKRTTSRGRGRMTPYPPASRAKSHMCSARRT